MRRSATADNAPASWSLGLGVLSVPLVFAFWPASPPVAVAAIVCGVLGLRVAERRDGGGRSRAIVGIASAAVAIVLFAIILYVVSTSGLL